MEVIIDEIQSYEDSPAELIFDDFEELIFPNHPLGRNILGKPDLLRNFTSQDALNFTKRYYRSTNMVFFILGDIDFRKALRTLEKVTADIPCSAVEAITASLRCLIVRSTSRHTRIPIRHTS